MFICWLSPNKKKKKKIYIVLEFTKLEYCVFFFFKGTWVLCCMVLEFTKLEYHIIFFNRTNSYSAVPRWQNWWGTRVSETRVLEKVILCHLFPKQYFFAKNFQKMWYLAILAKRLIQACCKLWLLTTEEIKKNNNKGLRKDDMAWSYQLLNWQ